MANKAIMNDDDAHDDDSKAKSLKLVRLEEMLSETCRLLQRTGALKDAPLGVRDWWGHRKAKLRRRSDADSKAEKWKD